jgi:alkanesulfonate monooxygenase SsuD/methylene tetrahydromethanopterin reductase-like flavin-dependent oxidoreductase (luciferase family)
VPCRGDGARGGRRWCPAGQPGVRALTPALFVSVRVDGSIESGRQALDDYANANYGMPLAELEKIQAVITGTPEHVAEGLGRYVAAGARHIVIRLGALDLHSQRDQLDRIAALIPMLG